MFASPIAYPKQTDEQIAAQIAAAEARWRAEDAGLVPRQTVYRPAEREDRSHDDRERYLEGLANWAGENPCLY
jgi:hypothetical protein